MLFSMDSDLELLGNLIGDAGFRTRLVAKRSIVIELLLIYELSSRLMRGPYSGWHLGT